MSRQTKRPLLLGLVVLGIGLFCYGRGGYASEAQEHGAPAQGGAAAGQPAAAGEHHEEDINPVAIEPGLMLWTIAVFILLMAILRRFAWNPLLAALHSREQHLEHVLLETERARNESEASLAEHRKLLARAGDEVRAMLDKARQEAQATADQLVKLAQSEAEQSKLRAQRDIGQARDQALAEIWEKTADMAVSVAGKVLTKELSDTDHRRLFEAAVKELPATQANGHGGKRV
jgi:F-type H+-transporting ATPase subunit b